MEGRLDEAMVLVVAIDRLMSNVRLHSVDRHIASLVYTA